MALKQEVRRPSRYDIDLNLLPEAHRKRSFSRQLLIIAIVAFSVISILRLGSLTGESRALLVENEARLVDARSQIDRIQLKLGDWKKLSAELLEKQKKGKALQDSLAVVEKRKAGWGGVLQVILSHTSQAVGLESVTGANGVVRMLGRASTLDAALGFARQLESSGKFARVVLVSYSARSGGSPKPAGDAPEPTINFDLVAEVKGP